VTAAPDPGRLVDHRAAAGGSGAAGWPGPPRPHPPARDAIL